MTESLLQPAELAGVTTTAPLGAQEQGAPLAAGADSLSRRERNRRLRQMVDQHWAFVGRVLRNMGVTEADLDDAVQQVFLVASAKLELIRTESERGFLAQTAVHMAARVRRTRGRSREDLDHEGLLDLPDPSEGPEVLADRQRALDCLQRILTSMSFELRSVFVLYELEEMTMVDIAALLEIPQGTVASRLRRARALFQTQARMFREPDEDHQAKRGQP